MANEQAVMVLSVTKQLLLAESRASEMEKTKRAVFHGPFLTLQSQLLPDKVGHQQCH